MKRPLPPRVERGRVRTGTFASSPADGNNGAFLLELSGGTLQLIVSDGEGWEHVSASFRNRCPTWPEMCYIKDLFWEVEEWVCQWHPPRSQYVNNHPYCLHLWRPTNGFADVPPINLVGIKALNMESA
jgi:hypothetical protein